MASNKAAKRNVHGVLLLDKRQGISSNLALQEVKRLYGARKAGHTGSLDPLATGLLPVCLGEATKLCSFILATDKRYRVAVRLGMTTSTGDAEGEVLHCSAVPELDEKAIAGVLRAFVGSVKQRPPMYSALKQNGKRLYELARQGIEVERPARDITIHQLHLLDWDADEKLMELDVYCSKGTYVRVLAEDIGIRLGCGAHVQRLRRTQVGHFQLDRAWRIEQLRALASDQERCALLADVDTMVDDWPRLSFAEKSAAWLRNGQSVCSPGTPDRGWVRLYTDGGSFIGLGEIGEDQRVAPRRIFNW